MSIRRRIKKKCIKQGHKGEFFVVDAEAVKHGRVEIADVNRILRHVVKEILLAAHQAKFFQLVIALRLCAATGRGRRCERGRAAKRGGQKQKAKGGANERSTRDFDGRVQQRIERTFGAITLSKQATPFPRLSPFRSFGG